jgi:hypothetical protein
MKFKFTIVILSLLFQTISIAAKPSLKSSLLTTPGTSQLPRLVENNNQLNTSTNPKSLLSGNKSPDCDMTDLLLAPTAAPCNGVSVTPINFVNTGTSPRTIESGTDLTTGVVYRYTNAGTAPDGTVVDALVTVQSYSNNQDATTNTFRDADIPAATAGFDGNLQPSLNQETNAHTTAAPWTGSITYRIRFVTTGTTTLKVLSVVATSLDNDGSNACGGLKESVTYSSALNQSLVSTTTNQIQSGNTFTPTTTTIQTGIGVGIDYASAALYVNVTELNWTYGFTTAGNCTVNGAGEVRYGSLNMSCQINFARNFASTTLSGTVFNDVNGLNGGNTVDGTGSTLTGLFANLLDSNGNVVASVAVSSTNGTYTFPTVVPGTYSVQISTNPGVESSAAPALALPTGWANTGEHLGAGAGSDAGVNGVLTGIVVGNTAVTNANLGIEQQPTANNGSVASNNNTGGTVFYTIAPTAFTATDPSSGTVTSIRITAFPSNATTIRVNGTNYTSATFPVGGITIPTNAAGNPTQAIAIDPINGNVTVGILYVAIDNAGVESASPATVSAPFAIGPTAANATISGRLIFNNAPIGNSLVVLTNAATGAKRSVRTNANGIYSFEEEVGATYVIQPLSSKYSFSPSSKFVELREDTTDENFVSTAKNYRVKNDFDGDGKSDPAVYRASEGNWYVLNSGNDEMSVFNFGLASDIPVSADFDGDGKTDYAVFRASEGNWYIRESSTQNLRVKRFGLATDKLVPGDYDGDGKDDVAVYRDGVWYISQSSDDSLKVYNWGVASDTPTTGDFDGDGKADAAVYRPAEGNWYVLSSSTNNWKAIRFGLESDVPVAGDFDGDGLSDIAQFRNGFWYVLNSTTDFQAEQFGQEADKTVPGDFDGDGRADLTVFKDGNWSIRNSGNGTVKNTNFGLADDVLVK